MGDARLLPRWRLFRITAAVAVLPALVGAAVADTARAEGGPPAPASTAATSTVAASTTTTSTAATATTTTATTTTATTTTATTTTATTTTATAAAAAASTRTLRRGATGPEVLRLHRRLVELGYDVGKVNSTFGDDTVHAVRAFQKVQGTRVDGVVTAATWARLDDPVVPQPRYTAGADAVEVDLTKRVLYLTRDGVVTAVFDVSPGKPSTPTVTGRFTIYRRVDRWDHGPLGGLYRPNYFHHGFALHGSLSVPPYSASHGCVRLTTAAMDRLWPRLSRGERVSVYRG